MKGKAMNKFKAWLIRKLGGYAHLSETPIIYRERPVVTLRGIAPAPDESDIIPIDKQREYAERNVLDMIAKAIYYNRLFDMTEKIDEISGRKIYKFTIKIVKPDGESNDNLYVNQFDDPKSFYQSASPDYSDWWQGKDGD
jgi:hypothetical protein